MTNPQPRKSSKSLAIIVSIVLIVLFGASYSLTLVNYLNEGKNNAVPFEIGDSAQADRLTVNAKMLSIDPVKGEMVVRFDLIPEGTLTTDGGYSSTRNLVIYINSATGSLERTFEKGKIINPFDVTLNIDGLVNNYPFDAYNGALVFDVTDKDKPDEVIPVVVDLTANIPGFAIDVTKDKESQESTPIIDLAITRSSTVTTVAISGMVIMWAIGIVVVFLTFSYVLGGRKPEAFAFYSGLLFGLFGLRNSLPGTPPIGTQSDFLSFLWVEAIVAVMMVITIAVSLYRPQK